MIILHVKVYNLILKTLNKKNQKVRILLNKQLSKYLGIDFGIKKSGVSISDSNKLISFPLETIETKNLLDYIKQINIDENIEIVVIGKPLKLNKNTIFQKLFFIFLKIGRKSISTGYPGRSRFPEFKK